MRNVLSFLLGFTLTLAVLGTLTLLSDCGLYDTASNLIRGGNTNGISAPSVGQWVDDGGIAINGNSFSFPVGNGSVVAGYFYTQLPAIPKIGQTLTINYTVTGINPVWQQGSGGGQTPDINPPTLHLFLWRKGDNEACDATTNHYRMFAARTPLVLGANQTISVVLDPTLWVLCGGVNETNSPAYMSDVLNNLLGAGFTFGGQYFAGHGIYLSSGSAQFTINSFTVQ